MDTNVIVALITASASIVSALITAVTGSGSADGTRRRLRSWRFVVITLALTATLGVAGLIASQYFVVKRVHTLAHNRLLPRAHYDYIKSFAEGDVTLEQGVFNFGPYPVYGPDQAQTKRENQVSLREVLQFKSSLTNPGGFLVATFYAPQETILTGKGLKLLLRVENDDTIEVKLTDSYHHDPHVYLAVHRGWAEYDVPYTHFLPSPLELNRIDEFHIGFSGGARSRQSNMMEVAWIDTYD